MVKLNKSLQYRVTKYLNTFLNPQQDDYQILFEQFSPTLIQHVPKQLVDLWKQRNLEPRSMIPSLVTQTESNNEESIRCAIDYLEHCVYTLKNEETAIHNYLVSLYCKISEERPLLRYLNSQGQVSISLKKTLWFIDNFS